MSARVGVIAGVKVRAYLRVAQLIGLASWLGFAACSSGGGGAMIDALAADAAGIDDVDSDEGAPSSKRDAGKKRDSAPSEGTGEEGGEETAPDSGRDAGKDAGAKDAARDAAKEGGAFDAGFGFDSGGGLDAGSTGPTESCSPVGTTCKVGGDMKLCSTYTTSSCVSMRYVHNGQSYNCSSCSSCDAAWGDAYVVCMDAQYGCDDLYYCCSQFPSQSQSSCYSAVTSYRAQPGGDVQCKSTYESYVNAGYCN